MGLQSKHREEINLHEWKANNEKQKNEIAVQAHRPFYSDTQTFYLILYFQTVLLITTFTSQYYIIVVFHELILVFFESSETNTQQMTGGS